MTGTSTFDLDPALLADWSDAFKCVYGIRPRFAPTATSNSDLSREIASLYQQAREEWQDSKRAEQESHDAAIQAALNAGAPDIETAERWVKDSV